MTSLVTGIGYIGAMLAQHLLDSGERVIGLDNLFSTDSDVIQCLERHPSFAFVEGDVRDEGDVARAFARGGNVETVYHLAAQSSSNPAAAPARYTEETNLIGARIVLEQALEAGAANFVFGSSLQVYGRSVEGNAAETRAYGTILDLSHLSKIHVEKLMEMFAASREIRCLSARIGLVYGIGPLMKTDPMFMTAPNKFCMLASTGAPLTVDSSAYYPTGMIHVEDAARGLVQLGAGNSRGAEGARERGREGEQDFQAVNLVGEVASVAGVAELVKRLAGTRGLGVEVMKPAEVPAVPTVDFGDTAARWGFSARHSLEDGLAEMLDYFTHRSPESRL